MALPLFILVNAALFIRPAELVPALEGAPIYNVLICACLLVSFPAVAGQVTPRRLKEQPISACVAGLGVAAVLSLLARLNLLLIREFIPEFAKVILYYFLLVGVLHTPGRLRTFLTWLVLVILALTGLALIHYHGIVDIPALKALERVEGFDEETGLPIVELQLMSTGIFNDPNDLSLVLVVGIMIAAHRSAERASGLTRPLWLAAVVALIYALFLTRSRGGLLSLLAGLTVLFVARFGWRRAMPLAAVVLPALLLLSGGRQTRISAGEDTAQERMELWSEGLHLLARSPLVGIGAARYTEEMNLVAHNSYVHAYTELGFPGGTLFVGLFFVPVWSLHRLGSDRYVVLDSGLRSLRPFLVAMIAGYSVGLLSLSRCYVVPTYMVAGLAAAYLRVAPVAPPGESLRFDLRLVGRTFAAGLSLLIFIYIIILICSR